MSHKLSIKEMQIIAKKRGGTCLADNYVGNKTKLRWQCAKGHVWEATPSSVKGGTWCRKCAGLELLTIEQMRELAGKRGGKCLSEKYINARTKLKWECSRGHQWEAIPDSIKRGQWCRSCGYIETANKQRGSIEQMHILATKRGGKCLSKEYINSQTKLKWRCADGHEWEARPNAIQRGAWCPNCGLWNTNENICREILEFIFKETFPKKRPDWLLNNRGKKMELDGYNDELALAFEYHGEQHFQHIKFFHGADQKKLHGRIEDDLVKRRKCKENGVRLLEIPYTVPILELYEYIVDQCKKLGVKIPQHKKVDILELKSTYHLEILNKMREIAARHGGKCLSARYINSISNLKWECRKGHKWFATPGNVVHQNNWCNICAGHARHTIEEMDDLAKSRGGKCLSKEYVNFHTKLTWQCAEGHIWEAKPSNISTGNWCPKCAKNVKFTIEEMQAVARERGGKCLSEKYINTAHKLKWQCKEGHQWEALPGNVIHGTWCPSCSAKRGWEKRKNATHKTTQSKVGVR